jgi:hypothetical protein
VKAPPLSSHNMYDRLTVDTMDNDSDDDTLVDSSVHNGRGSQVAELNTLEACLIPCESHDIVTQPKEGVKNKYFIRLMKVEREVLLNVSITMMDTHEMVQVKVLLDSSTTGMFIDQQVVHQNRLKTQILLFPIKVYNVDGGLNQGGLITEEVTLMMSHRGHKEKATFEVCNLGKAVIIVRDPWLQKHNLDINWETGQVKMTQCPPECNVFIHMANKEQKQKRIATRWKYRVTVEEVEDEDMQVHIRGRTTEGDVLMEGVEMLPQTMEEHFIRKTERLESWGDKDLNPQAKDGVEKTVEEMVPKWFHKYLKVFSKKELEQMLL